VTKHSKPFFPVLFAFLFRFTSICRDLYYVFTTVAQTLSTLSMPARLRLSWSMKSLKLFLVPLLDSLEFAWQLIRYALIFVSPFFRQRTSLGCEIVPIRSQLTFYEESIRQKRQPRPRFHPAFRLLWVPVSNARRMFSTNWSQVVVLTTCPHREA
jgi:hypothetical protein